MTLRHMIPVNPKVWLGAPFLIFLAACSGTAEPQVPTPAPTLERELPTQRPAKQASADELPDELATSYMYDLSSRDRDLGSAALEAVLDAQDQRFVAVLIEVMRGIEVGMFLGTDYDTTVSGLETLSGESFGANWPAWVEWYGATDLTPPPGFTGWKGDVLTFIDPRFADFLRDDAPSKIRVEEIQWGGVSVDGIPALDNAPMVPADQADYLLPGEPVFGVAINGDARAYPLRIMDWHEMANDVVGGVPMSLAYCTLCGAGIAFDGRASNGQTYDFGSSGFLYRSNKLMYDRQTRTLWNQLTGEPVLGELVEDNLELTLLPVVLTSWEDWLAQHPDTQVLELETGFERYYLPGAAYGDYFSSTSTMFPVWQRGEQLDTKDRIYALRIDGTPKAYPLNDIILEGVVNDQIGDTNVVLVANRGRVMVQGENRRVGQVIYDSGGEVRAFDRGDEVFAVTDDPDVVVDSQGRKWRVTEEALLGPDGETAPRINGHLAYWFGWFAFFPNTLVYGSDLGDG
ncbi:MAG: DUF3179 domain-containing protein [Anaerolineales bacterium]